MQQMLPQQYAEYKHESYINQFLFALNKFTTSYLYI